MAQNFAAHHNMIYPSSYPQQPPPPSSSQAGPPVPGSIPSFQPPNIQPPPTSMSQMANSYSNPNSAPGMMRPTGPPPTLSSQQLPPPPGQLMSNNAAAARPPTSSYNAYPPAPQQQQQQAPQSQYYQPSVQQQQSQQQYRSLPQPPPQTQQALQTNHHPPQPQQPYASAYSQPPQMQQPQSQQYQQQQQMDQLTNKMGSMVVNQGWNAMWANESINLMAEKEIRTKWIQQEAQIRAQKQQQLAADPAAASRRDTICDSEVMRCTLKKVPDTASLLQKCRLPLGLILHPFKDDPNIPLMQDTPIVRCRSCRTYINPFVRLLDQKRWQCNLCSRVNEVPDEFIYDFQRQRHMDIMTRPELNYGTIEYVASVEYMVRPPQPATYLFVFECTASAVQSGYISRFARAMLDSLDSIPGDARTMLGFLAFDSKLHFFNLNDDRPVHYIMPDIEDTFIPHTDSVLVNLKTHRKLVEDFLTNVLPTFPFDATPSATSDNVADHEAALGPALQVAFKIVSPSGGRITLIQTSLPAAGNKSEGSVLTNREDPNQRTANSSNSTAALTPLLNPSTDFYKRLALECSEQQVTVDLFNLAASYSDLATVGTIAKFSGGSIQYYGGGGTPSSPNAVSAMLNRFEADMKHYLTRSIGFEAVMRLRTTRGISIHTFHGNFFVRSTDLIALPNVNPDSSYAIQMTISEDLKEFNQICLQAALLYTASNGERRIRVHTIALPVVTIMADVIAGADQEAIVCLLGKMAVDRSMQSNVQDAREALINANVDAINTYRSVNANQYAGLFASSTTRLLPLYTLALMKHTAFRLGISTRVDERVFAMMQMKSLPIDSLLLYIYPNLYPIHYQFDPSVNPPSPVQLTFANIDRNGVYLLDTYDHLYIYICKSVHPQFLAEVFNVTQWSQIPDEGDQNTTSGSTTPAIGTTPTSMLPPGGGTMFGRNAPIPQQQPPLMNGHYNPNVANSQMTQQALPPQSYGAVKRLVHNDSIASDVTTEDSVSDPLVDDYSPTSEQEPKSLSNGDEEDSPTSETRSLNSSLQVVKKSPTVTLPLLDNATSQRIHQFINSLIDDRPFKPNFHILREDSRLRYSFLQYMYDDRNESAFSYYEFLQHLQQHLDK